MRRTARLRSLAPAAHAAAREASHPAAAAAAEIHWAIAHTPAAVRAVLLHMPARQAGKSRLDTLLYALDAGIRARTSPRDACRARHGQVHLRRSSPKMRCM